ncbi:hypothetical protein BGY98DRAFT_931790 [Russula aff. rugulosa BPL654]|nr:hypothetical protein BGY98DRAFT_931790 [Russula aff. rugulosa BPL654]
MDTYSHVHIDLMCPRKRIPLVTWNAHLNSFHMISNIYSFHLQLTHVIAEKKSSIYKGNKLNTFSNEKNKINGFGRPSLCRREDTIMTKQMGTILLLSKPSPKEEEEGVDVEMETSGGGDGLGRSGSLRRRAQCMPMMPRQRVARVKAPIGPPGRDFYSFLGFDIDSRRRQTAGVSLLSVSAHRLASIFQSSHKVELTTLPFRAQIGVCRATSDSPFFTRKHFKQFSTQLQSPAEINESAPTIKDRILGCLRTFTTWNRISTISYHPHRIEALVIEITG